jgi:ribosomal protein S4E
MVALVRRHRDVGVVAQHALLAVDGISGPAVADLRRRQYAYVRMPSMGPHRTRGA